MSRRSTFDLLVVGGGPAGCGTAIAATRLGLRVALVEREASRVVRQGESLPPSVRPLLERLGVLDAFLDTGPLACYANRSLWGGDGIAAEYDFLNEPYGAGWQIDRPAVDAMLLGAAEGTGATVLRGRGLRDLRREGSGWLAEVDDAGCVRQVGALVAADTSGRARVVARRVGARFRAVDRLLAAVWQVDAQPGVDTATLVDAVPEGWWYSAFLPNGRLTLVFFTDPHLLRAHGVRAAGGGQRLLLQAPATLSRMSDAGASLAEPPLVVSAASGRLERAAGEGWLAAGDAAATFDPISSHGVGAALDAGMAAASAIRGVLDGDADALDAYEWRVRHGFARYLRIWQTVYQQEDRWPCAPFWRRRHAAAPRSWLRRSGRHWSGSLQSAHRISERRGAAMTLAVGDRVCIDVTAAKQLPVQGYEALLTHNIPDIWLPGTVVMALADGRYEVDLDSVETGPVRFLAHEGFIRRPRPDGGCGE